MDVQNQPRVFPVIGELAAQARQAAAEATNPLTQLAQTITVGIRGDADPYVLIGVLVEGIAQTIGGIPAARRSGAILATAVMLRERIREHSCGRGDSLSGRRGG